MNIQEIASSAKLKSYLHYLEKQGASRATLNRHHSSLKQFQQWLQKEYQPQREIPVQKKDSLSPALPVKTSPIFRYFSYLLGLLLLAGLGFGIYQQFIAQPPEEPSLAALPTLPPNLISFQGRLTNAVETPISATVSAGFKLYNVDTGGSDLWSETKDIEPDNNGIFNTMLGSSNPIDASIFADNTSLWLGITIDADGEMDPRQQIATVGYAYNTKYLQGYPASSSATANTIPVINASGDLVLASASPSLESTSGTFGIKGQAILLQSTGGAGGGDITIQPDANDEGQVIINSSTTSDDSFTVQNANITSGDLIAAEAGTNGSGFTLSSF